MSLGQASLTVTVILSAYVLQQRTSPFVTVAAVADNLVAAVGSVDRVDALSKLTQVHDAWHPVFSLPHLGGGITVTMCGPTLSAVKCCLLAVGWVIARVG